MESVSTQKLEQPLNYVQQLNIVKSIISEQNFNGLTLDQFIKPYRQKVKHINRYSISSLVISDWYQLFSNKSYLKQISEIIAFEMYSTNRISLTYQEINQIKQIKQMNKGSLERILMIENGDNYAFIKNTLLIFNVTQYIINKIIRFKCKFSPQQITKSSSLCNIIRQWYSYNESSYDTLMNIVLKSREDKSIQRSAAAAITILNMVGCKFSNINLSGISIPYADLTGGYFQNTDLSDSNLKNVIFDNNSCILKSKFRGANMRGVSQTVRSTDIDKQGKNLVLAMLKGFIRLYEIKGFKMLRQWVIQNTINIIAIKFTDDGKRLVYHNTSSIFIFSIQAGCIIKKVEVHKKMIATLSYTPSGNNIFASGGLDQYIVLWNEETGSQIRKLIGKFACLTLCYSPDGQKLVGGYRDNLIRIWETSTGSLLNSLKHNDIFSICFSMDGKKIISNSYGPIFKIWDIQTGKIIQSINAHSSAIISICCSFDNKGMMSSSKDKTIKVWDSETGKHINTRKGQYQTISRLNFTPDGKYLIISGVRDNSNSSSEIKIQPISPVVRRQISYLEMENINAISR